MVRSSFAILISAWAFCGMPALCVAGVLDHWCTPLDESCCKPDAFDCSQQEPNCPDDSGCRHESGCEADPCSIAVVHRDPSSDIEPLLFLQPVVLVECIDDHHRELPARHYPTCTASDGIQAAIHQSDLPLLI
jgi:hypothetical protein